MAGETDLSTLLRSMKPVRRPAEYVFCSVATQNLKIEDLHPICLFEETEGTTLVLTREEADLHALSYTATFCMITLSIHSSLEAVGFLAAVTAKLAERNISVNPVSAYYHDHLFVPFKKADEVMMILKDFSGSLE